MYRRIGLIAGGVAVALAAVAGCSTNSTTSNGGSNGSGAGAALNISPAAFIKSALTKTSDYKTVHVTGTISGGTLNATMDAHEQFSPSIAMSMTLSSSALNVTEILVGDTIYMKIPQLSGELGGKTWVKIDLSAMGSLGSAFESMTNSAKSMDPTQQLQLLLASGDLRKVGTETVDGVQAVHYAGTVDAATFVNSAAATANLTPDQISQLKSLLKAGGVTTESVDLWAASDGLPVREKVATNTSMGAVTVDLHMSDWGKPVSVSAPPADQVGDMSSMLGNLGSLGSAG
ncbi:MAG TPA: LppX_LprAFG lipoprotein [Actinocrinis sp.]|uniref:LppX_LprAFG lipoprotein n=1 Tax=Actinocrinis sp. TaxID=1920516 RepID=UPI002DDD6151|nr:LppX_LprAFG lipoprotein [Actinocrinis sp.]HEV2347639.1 LppX_LprAFG lipoprotein [Actinocrinis sp.]